MNSNYYAIELLNRGKVELIIEYDTLSEVAATMIKSEFLHTKFGSYKFRVFLCSASSSVRRALFEARFDNIQAMRDIMLGKNNDKIAKMVEDAILNGEYSRVVIL